jgi:hypothetical protein
MGLLVDFFVGEGVLEGLLNGTVCSQVSNDQLRSQAPYSCPHLSFAPTLSARRPSTGCQSIF